VRRKLVQQAPSPRAPTSMTPTLTGKVGVAGKGTAAVARKLDLWNHLDEALGCVGNDVPHLSGSDSGVVRRIGRSRGWRGEVGPSPRIADQAKEA